MDKKTSVTTEKCTEISHDLTNVVNLFKKAQGLASSLSSSLDALKSLKEMGDLVTGVNKGVTDTMVERIAGTVEKLGELSNLLTQVDVKEIVESMNRSAMKTIDEAKEKKYRKGGILSLLSLTRNPEVIRGLKFMMLLSKNLAADINIHKNDIFISSIIEEKVAVVEEE
jgi:uncharacterized protein YjgD (DUF1641 family)